LVAITPASGFVSPLAALVIGLLAGLICYGAVCLKPFLKYDDSLDAFGVHGVGGFLGAVLTGVFAWTEFWQHGQGSSSPLGVLADGRLGQVQVQLLAALVAVGYTFVLTLILVKGIDRMFGFCLPSAAENEGLDQSQHGEVGFDLGPAQESVPEQKLQEPKAAAVPPNGQKRFTVVVEGADSGDLIHAWSELCQAGPEPPTSEFRAVYPFVTTVQGNRFRFRGGDPNLLSKHLARLFQDQFKGWTIRAHVEN
jgi:hypothetical protein